MKNGLFIIFEGGEGGGKSSVIRYLHDTLKNMFRDINLIITREPGGSPYGELMRKALFDIDYQGKSVMAELLTFCAGRADHCDNLIRPALQSGKLILCDRFSPSTYAYQICGRNLLHYEGVYSLVDSIARGKYHRDGEILPDLVIWLNIDPEIGRGRILKFRQEEITHFDQESADFHRRVHAGYSKLCNENKNWDWIEVDASQTLEWVKARCLSIVCQIICQRMEVN